MGSSLQKAAEWSSGSWNDAYSGRTITDATKLDIDHMVPLKEVHRSGAAHWSRERKRAYVNDMDDPDTLIAVDCGLNRQKGAMPSERPPSTTIEVPLVHSARIR